MALRLTALLLCCTLASAGAAAAGPMKLLVFSEECFETFFTDLDFLHVECLENGVMQVEPSVAAHILGPLQNPGCGGVGATRSTSHA